jgi:hypothetical protein
MYIKILNEGNEEIQEDNLQYYYCCFVMESKRLNQ